MPQLVAEIIRRLGGLTAPVYPDPSQGEHAHKLAHACTPRFDKLGSSADKVAELGPKVAAALGTRGGMRPGAFQGKVASLDRLPQALKVLHDSLAQSRRSLDNNVVRDLWLLPHCV